MTSASTSSSRGSILCTVKVPSFDPVTRQLSCTSHHLISIPNSFLNALPGDYSISLQPPPSTQYQSTPSATADTTPEGHLSRRKRRRLTQSSTEHFSPLEWAQLRAKDNKKSTADKETDSLHARILPLLEGAIEAIQNEWRSVGQCGDWLGVEIGSDRVHWIQQQDSATTTIDWTSLASCSGGTSSCDIQSPRFLEGDFIESQAKDLLQSLVVNKGRKNIALSVITSSSQQNTYVLPPSSAFRVLDFDSWPSNLPGELSCLQRSWDILVMDPPWPNASATRSSSYATFDPYTLGKLDLKAMLGDHDCLVAVWVTNRVKYRRLVTEKLFPSWGVTGAVDWWWVKISSSGEPVWSLDNAHRRCYEGLIVGRYNPQKLALPPLPRDKVFLACPVGHSRKPVLLDLLKSLTRNAERGPNVLELFSRMTIAGHVALSNEGHDSTRGLYVAVGNEPIKFNALSRSFGPSSEGASQDCI